VEGVLCTEQHNTDNVKCHGNPSYQWPARLVWNAHQQQYPPMPLTNLSSSKQFSIPTSHHKYESVIMPGHHALFCCRKCFQNIAGFILQII